MDTEHSVQSQMCRSMNFFSEKILTGDTISSHEMVYADGHSG